MEKNLKNVSLLLKVGAVVCLVYAGMSLGKVIYYKGRIDAAKQIKGEVDKVYKEFNDKIEKNRIKKDMKYAIDKEVGELREEQKKHKENGES